MTESHDIVLTIVLTTLLILLLIAGLTISFFISSRQNTKKEMELTNAKLNYEKELRKVEVEVSEHMTHQFAQELHDNIGQLLTCLRLEVENKKLDHPEVRPVFAQMEKYLDETVLQLQLLSRTLNSDYVSQLGLSKAIQLEVDRQKQIKKFNVHWTPNGEAPALDRNEQLMVFRILQEIINNALKHSTAKNLFIDVTTASDFQLTVRDDGRGFDLERILLTEKASGVRNILRRTSMAGFHCNVKTAPGEGCTYVIKKMNHYDRK
jgi:two-component system, NarL family, sensor kinase